MAQEISRIFIGGDHVRRLENAFAAYKAAVKAEDTEAADTLLAEYEQIKAAAEADAEDGRRSVTVRALSRRAWREIKAAHPPRTGDAVDEETADLDRVYGANVDEIEDVLVYKALVHPVFEHAPGEDTDALPAAFKAWADDTLSNAEWGQVFLDALTLVRKADFDPKSLRSSAIQSAGES